MDPQFTLGGDSFPLRAPIDRFLRDTTADALLDFLSYWLNYALNPQFAVMAPKGAEVVPDDNRFAYDPGEHWPQNPIPALYIWRKNSRTEDYTTVKSREISTYGLKYIAEDIRMPDGGEHFSGLSTTVERVLRYACDQGFHPSYGYNGAPLGEQLHISAGIQGWEILSLQAGMAHVTPDRHGASVDFYPIVQGEIRVYTEMTQPEPQESAGGVPGASIGDVMVSIATTDDGDVANALPFLEGVIGGPDGSEDGDA